MLLHLLHHRLCRRQLPPGQRRYLPVHLLHPQLDEVPRPPQPQAPLFPDSPWDAAPNNPINTPQFIRHRMFGAGDPFFYLFESVTNFWSRAS